MLSCTIDAKEESKIITADIPGALMQAHMDDTVHMKIVGPMVDLLVKANSKKYGKFVTSENGKPVIYGLLKKALYGTLQAALIFWKNLSGKLMHWGFVLNPNNNCVANKTIDGSQSTVLWYVDDIKISR
jgi:hypothetical protein